MNNQVVQYLLISFGRSRIRESKISTLDFGGTIKLQRPILDLSVLIDKFKESKSFRL